MPIQVNHHVKENSNREAGIYWRPKYDIHKQGKYWGPIFDVRKQGKYRGPCEHVKIVKPISQIQSLSLSHL